MAKKKTPAVLSVALNRPISTQQQQILLLLSQRIAADARAYEHVIKGWIPNTVRWPQVSRSRSEAASVSRTMRRLKERGLIKHMRYITRNRLEFVHITEAGMELIHRLTSCPS